MERMNESREYPKDAYEGIYVRVSSLKVQDSLLA